MGRSCLSVYLFLPIDIVDSEDAGHVALIGLMKLFLKLVHHERREEREEEENAAENMELIESKVGQNADEGEDRV